MTASRDPDRLIHAFLFEGEEQLHDQIYDAVRAEIEQKRQRAVVGPWRLPTMNKLVPIGLGAAIVLAVLVLGSQFLRSPSGPGGPSVEPTPTPVASVATPSPSPARTTAPLTQTFTSQMHGFSVSYPEGWTARAATQPWTDRPGDYPFIHPGFDVLADPVLTDHLFLNIVSHPIGDSTPDEWVAARIAVDEGCTTTEPIAVGGATGLIGGDGCDVAAVAIAGRGYVIALLTSNDDPDAVAPYDRAWFEEVLATVQLQPEDAVDAAPSASP